MFFTINSKKDFDIINFMCNILSKANLRPLIYKDKRFNCIRVRIRSKEFYIFIKTFDKKMLESKQLKIGFISGVIDAEGYVNLGKSVIEIINTNEEMLKKIKKYLQDLSIKTTLAKRKPSIKDRRPSYRLTVSVNFIKIRNHSLKVKRCLGLRNSGVDKLRES